jgi:hypothetical protein
VHAEHEAADADGTGEQDRARTVSTRTIGRRNTYTAATSAIVRNTAVLFVRELTETIRRSRIRGSGKPVAVFDQRVLSWRRGDAATAREQIGCDRDCGPQSAIPEQRGRHCRNDQRDGKHARVRHYPCEFIEGTGTAVDEEPQMRRIGMGESHASRIAAVVCMCIIGDARIVAALVGVVCSGVVGDSQRDCACWWLGSGIGGLGTGLGGGLCVRGAWVR